jgi:uncharacterized protein YgiM (DUF1202 family)
VVTTLQQGQTAPILEIDPDSGWLRVALPGDQGTGWISGSSTYVSVQGQAPAATAASPRPTPALTPTPLLTPTAGGLAIRAEAEIVTGSLNVRQGPGLDYPAVGALSEGETVPVLEIDPGSGWLRVRLPGDRETGWISGAPAYVQVRERE